MLKKVFLAAASVIAGGTLEDVLSRYCQKHGIVISGNGSISTCNGAVDQARKAHINLYSATDGKLVESWGAIRTEAAHNPGAFNRTKQEVDLMIRGIQGFISRIA